ncbi:hypothetical protein [Nonomuraea sp. NPDC002799]
MDDADARVCDHDVVRAWVSDADVVQSAVQAQGDDIGGIYAVVACSRVMRPSRPLAMRLLKLTPLRVRVYAGTPWADDRLEEGASHDGLGDEACTVLPSIRCTATVAP